MANLPVEVITKPDENGDVQVRPVGHIETILCVEADKLIDPHEADDLTDYRGWRGRGMAKGRHRYHAAFGL